MTLMNGFDTRMTRRSLLLSLPALAAARAVLNAQGSGGTLKIRAFNADVRRRRAGDAAARA